METQPHTGLTYEDMVALPHDNLFRELIGGELIVTPSPSPRHQMVVATLVASLYRYAEEHGGIVLPAPMDELITDRDVLQPDVLFVTAEHRDRVGDRNLPEPPDVVVEVLSESTRSLVHTRKRDLYARHGVEELWVVDLEAERLEVYRLGEGGYGQPEMLAPDEVFRSPILPGFELPLRRVLRPEV